jgi:hypothetical protein
MRLTMSPQNAGLVLQGRKTTTIRPLTYLDRFSVGDEVKLGRTDRKVRIEKIRKIRLSQVDTDILASEGGFESRAKLFEVLKRFYPRLTNRSSVLLIRFTLV